jgi:hypothetical protein
MSLSLIMLAAFAGVLFLGGLVSKEIRDYRAKHGHPASNNHNRRSTDHDYVVRAGHG